MFLERYLAVHQHGSEYRIQKMSLTPLVLETDCAEPQRSNPTAGFGETWWQLDVGSDLQAAADSGYVIPRCSDIDAFLVGKIVELLTLVPATLDPCRHSTLGKRGLVYIDAGGR